MALDIAEMLFVDILRMTNYPTLASGNILQDVVMLLFIPTVIIIVFVYLILDALKILKNSKIKLLFGIAMYLFIIFSGYYGTFAALSGPYMVLVIFVFGILYFIIGHFRGKHEVGGTRPTPARYARGAYHAIEEEKAFQHLPEETKNIFGVHFLTPNQRHTLTKQRDRLDKEIARLERELGNLPAGSDADRTRSHLSDIRMQRDDIEDKLSG